MPKRRTNIPNIPSIPPGTKRISANINNSPIKIIENTIIQNILYQFSEGKNSLFFFI